MSGTGCLLRMSLRIKHLLGLLEGKLKENKYKENVWLETIVEELKSAALPEDLNSISRSHMGHGTTLSNSNSRVSDALF